MRFFFLWFIVHFLFSFSQVNACNLHRACVLHGPVLSDTEWKNVQEWVAGLEEFPELIQKMILRDHSEKRLVHWHADEPTMYEDKLVGRRYVIKSRVEMGVTFSVDHSREDLIHAFLTSFYPAKGESVPDGLNTSLMSSMTTFVLLLYRWSKENPTATQVMVQTSRLENAEIARVFERMGFERRGSGMNLLISLRAKKP